MSAPESLSFFSLAEREHSAGVASIAGDKIQITKHTFIPGKEFDDIQDELRAAVSGGKTLVQASMPLTLVALKSVDASNPEALLSVLAKTSSIEADDLRLSIVDRTAAALLTQPADLRSGYALGYSKKAIQARSAQVSSLGLAGVGLYCRAANVLAALGARLASKQIDQPVLYLDILPGTTHLYVAAADELADLGSVDSGSDLILEQVMAALSLRFPGSAAKLFFGDVYDFDDHAAKLIETVVEKARGRLGSSKGKVPTPVYLYASGIPSSRLALLAPRMAEPLGLRPLQLELPVEADGVSVPAYYPAASLGLWQMVRSGGINLNAPEQDWKALVAASLAATPTPAPAKAAVPPPPPPPPPPPAAAKPAPAATPAKAAPPAPPAPPAKAATPAPATPAKPAEPSKVPSKQPIQKKGKGPIPVPPKAAEEKPADPKPAEAKAVEAKPAEAKPAPAKPSPAKKPAAQAAAKGKSNSLLYAAIGVIVVGAIVGAVVFSGGEETPTVEPQAQQVAPEPEPAPQAEPEVVAPAPEPEPVVVEEPPPPPPPAIGNISMQTIPSEAEVYVNGEYRGMTPLALQDQPSGKYAIEFRKAGYISRALEAEVVTGETSSIHGVTLEVQRGEATVSTEPADAVFEVEAIDAQAGAIDPAVLNGTTPGELPGLLPGRYRVSFSREGWPDYTQEFEVRSGETTRVSFQYQPGTVRVTSTPEGAAVSVDGELRGTTPAEIGGIPEGTHEVYLERSGYEPETLTVSVPAGGEVNVQQALLDANRLITNPQELDSLPTRVGGSLMLDAPAEMARGRSSVAVFVRLQVGRDGRVENVQIIRTEAPELDDYVLRTLQTWQFTPARRKGLPMRTVVAVPINLSFSARR